MQSCGERGLGEWEKGKEENGFDILAGTREIRRKNGDRSDGKRQEEKKRSATQMGGAGASLKDVGPHIWSREGKDD